MHKWAKQYEMECRLLSRRAMLMSLPMVYAAFFWLVMYFNFKNPMQNLYYSIDRIQSVGHTMTLGVAIFLGITLARRDLAKSAYDWVKSYPISSGVQLTAKYAAILSYLTIFTILIAASMLIAGQISGLEVTIVWPRVQYFAIQYEVSYAVTAALGMLLGVIISNRAVYLIGFCAWIFGTFFMEIFVLERYGWHLLKTFHLSQLFIESGKWYQTWSVALFADERNASRVFVLMFAMLLLAVSILVLNYKRPVRRTSHSWIAAVCILAVCAGTFIPYSSIWAEKNDQIQAILHDPNVKMEGESGGEHQNIFAISSYDLSITQKEQDILEGFAVMRLEAKAVDREADALKFTLNRAFAIKELHINDEPASYDREGDWITVRVPEYANEPTDYEIVIRYQGKLVIPSNSNFDVYYSFSSGENTYLGGMIGWYPIPGTQSIYEYRVGAAEEDRTLLLANTLQVEPVDMRVTFRNFKNEMYTTLDKMELKSRAEAGDLAASDEDQVFAGRVTSPLTAIGASFSEMTSEIVPLKVYSTPFAQRSVQHVMSLVEEQFAYFKSWLPSLQPQFKQLYMYGDPLYLSSLSDIHNASYIHNDLNSSYDAFTARNWMNALMFGDQAGADMLLATLSERNQLTETTADIRHLIGMICWYVYYLDYEHEPQHEAMSNSMLAYYLMRYDALSSDLHHMAAQIISQVDQAMQAGQTDQVKQVLHHFYKQDLSVPPVKPNEVDFITPQQWNKVWDQVMSDE
ncbi:hypothetical protein PUW24_03875 [Paenibacillus urinalis]|uniref:ABC transporter permease n=1 Tax=Paenibacillus urinalis TaxID=521520 RepID=A0ABY7X7J1_9BACL|nr:MULTISPECIES: hypothetical protein [Paenibacillus]WDH98109.1 hypothetical protein PUW24_03875 [Paenibacillus urinalis]WDI01792.1 hypothetical protein PUW25_21605 [Paenibacillus urinalis]GAK42682.1 ABC transporter permease protein [Paenibacillus sp. TCA20]